MRSGGRNLDPAGLMRKSAFILFSAGWLVHNLRVQGDEEMTQCVVDGNTATPRNGEGPRGEAHIICA